MKKIIVRTKSIIFDMDGVITNTMPDHYSAWKKIFYDRGLSVSREEIYKREGQPGMNTVRELFSSPSKIIDDKSARAILKDKEDLFKKIVKVRFIDGARNLVKWLKSEGFILALVTGTARHELHKILPDTIYKMFSVVITGSDVKHGKPDPEPYLMALKKLKLNPKEAAVIENAPFGITSAKAAGLRCLALETSLPQEYLTEADHIFLSIAELKKTITFKNDK